MHAVIVIPCLNEERSIEETSRSLGFGASREVRNSTLVLVDNGSTDGTAGAMARIAGSSRPGEVIVVKEAERGYVPARCRGAAEACELSRRLGLEEDRMLLVQADADTVYLPGYVEALRKTSLRAGPGALIEGLSEAPEPAERFGAYHALERLVDAAVEPAFGDMGEDVIVDDKVAAFQLSDYRRWGGHRREYGRDGDEILAETSRLFIRAKLRGGFRVRAEDAVAITSQRRTFEDSALAFATAGYPRGPRWKAAFRDREAARIDAAGFGLASNVALLRELSRIRAGHLLGMFGLLPAWFSAKAGLSTPEDHGFEATYAALLVDAPSRERIGEQPGRLVDWALGRPSEDIATSPRIAEALQSMTFSMP